jgi:hypothetical protein
MPNFSFVLLYVENPPASAGFYADLLGRPILENSPTFAMLPLREGVMLGLWSRKTVELQPMRRRAPAKSRSRSKMSPRPRRPSRTGRSAG